MIHPSEAKKRYGFRDATDREDVLTMSLLNSIQVVQKSKTIRLTEFLMPFIVFGLCIAAGIYTYRNGVQLAVVVLPVFMLLIYVPQMKDMISRKKDASGITHDEEKLGSHFLLAYGTCMQKREKMGLGGTVYSANVKMQNGEILENVLLVREFYERVKEKQRIFVAMADSDEAKQLIGVIPTLYDTKVMKEKQGSEQVTKPDSRKIRRISAQERQECEAYYIPMRKAMLRTQTKNRMMVFLVPAVVCAVVSFIVDRVVLMTLGLILLSSYIFTYLTDLMEIKSTAKSLQNDSEIFVLDAVVSGKPVLESQQVRVKGQTPAIDFRDAAGKLVHRSTLQEDLQNLNIGDEVYLVYIGPKKPLACRKPSEETEE